MFVAADVCFSSPILLTKVISDVEAGRHDVRAPRSLDRVLRTGETLCCGVRGWCYVALAHGEWRCTCWSDITDSITGIM